MINLEQQELFEIEVLEWLKNRGFLKNLIFGGGTMLRLCHNLNRYSIDLDFWLYYVQEIDIFYNNIKNSLTQEYTIIDTQNKYYTLLFEIKKAPYPRKLKIEIRKKIDNTDFQEKIAYSKQGNIQVLVKGFTLDQMMTNKTKALSDRKEIRDAFDIEFLLRSGVELPADKQTIMKMFKIVKSFNKRDYYVTLGSLLEPKIRNYYKQNGFIYLLQKLNQKLSYM
jgi:predicted nucleotidyltransferase component of viral defense system